MLLCLCWNVTQFVLGCVARCPPCEPSTPSDPAHRNTLPCTHTAPHTTAAHRPHRHSTSEMMENLRSMGHVPPTPGSAPGPASGARRARPRQSLSPAAHKRSSTAQSTLNQDTTGVLTDGPGRTRMLPGEFRGLVATRALVINLSVTAVGSGSGNEVL